MTDEEKQDYFTKKYIEPVGEQMRRNLGLSGIKIPKDSPSVIFWDPERGDAFEHFKQCCQYLESKHIKSEISLDRYDNSWSLEDMDHAIFEVEVQIKELEGVSYYGDVTVNRTISISNDKNFKLCLVLDNQAWFTTQDPKLQWGDDWDDEPYEHNAGTPYEWDGCLSSLPYTIKKVYWESFKFQIPILTLDKCVCDINKNCCAWLEPCVQEEFCILPGTTLEEFKKLVDVYELSKPHGKTSC